MPVALQVDKGLIQALYMKGRTPTEIAKQFNLNASTVHAWVKRHGWARDKANAQHALQSQAIRFSTPALSRAVANVSERTREGLAFQLEGLVERLGQVPTGKGLKGVERKASVTKLLVDASRPVMGWDEQRMSGAVSVESMLDLSPVSTQPVIDAPGSIATQVAITESALASDLVSEAQKTQAIDTQATESTYDSFVPDL